MRAVKILERILYAIPIMLGVAIIVFVSVRLTPGDPVDIMMGQGGAVSSGEIEQLRREFHLDWLLGWQFSSYALGDDNTGAICQALSFLPGCGAVQASADLDVSKGLIRGDLGYSYIKKQRVVTLIKDRLPATIELATGALLFALAVAFPIGVVSAVRQNSPLDRLSMGAAFLGISMPSFWLGIVLILIFGVWLRWLPVQGRIDPNVDLEVITGFYALDSIITRNWEALKSTIEHLILPAITLGAAVAAIVARVLRSSMLETLRTDYVHLARAKGAPEGTVVRKHALRNALIPTVTVVGLQVGVLLGGNMIVETVFGWPGLGRLVVEAIFNRDFPLVQGAVMVYAFTFVIANLIVDVLYTYLNPKISL